MAPTAPATSRPRTRVLGVALVAQLAAVACAEEPYEQVEHPASLAPYPNPFDATDPRWSAQPWRAKPMEIVVHPAGHKAYVSLPGTPDEPGDSIAVIDLDARKLARRIEVGSGPEGLALHPDGEILVVLNRYSNFVSVIDTRTDEVVHSPEVDFYATRAVFSPDGERLYLGNRWTDSVAIWRVARERDGLAVLKRDEPGIPVATNPRDMAISGDGATLAVASMTGIAVSLIDTAARAERLRIDVGAPANDVAILGDLLFVATLSDSSHHFADRGPDTDENGEPGDGTPNINFQDLQNELAVYRLSTGEPLWRYTSDTICCKDYRDVDPLDDGQLGSLLPPAERWIVAGALPEQLLITTSSGDAPELWVTYSASNEVQRFAIDESSGALTSLAVWPTGGHNPHDLARAGNHLLVSHRLTDEVSIHDFDGTRVADISVAGSADPPFPATDAEIGELYNFVTALFTIDGDQSCAHCHREGDNIAKAFGMPLTRYPGFGLRMTMAYRGAADTRPWFFESGMDDSNFRAVVNEFARIENFCCSDYTLWPDGAPADCKNNPPAACSEQPNAGSIDGVNATRGDQVENFPHPRPSASPTRDLFFLSAAETTFGRSASFGDGLYFEDPITSQRTPVPLDFDGVTRALGLFLLTDTNLLPNPNDADSPAALRGRAIFESADTGCSACHPAPSYAASTDVNPAGVPLLIGPVVSPVRADDGTNLDLVSDGFLTTFPLGEMETCEEVCGAEVCAADPSVCDDQRNVLFGIPSLRGIWDRAPMFLHHGRAHSLREVLCTPGHPALASGERGFNERDGIIDTHGATSHLSADEIDDLIAFLSTL